ncbi:MAG: ATP dependent RNA helicase [Thiohalocapsa sp.]|jgi:hypothetical protein|nr:ATP dependent RNA helicase [Thiohalocapsa sp.]
MSVTEIAALDAALPVHLPPEAIKQRIRGLVRRYVHRRSPQLARAIVYHGEALCLHPALHDEPEQLAAFCRLTRHWRMLAAQCPPCLAA